MKHRLLLFLCALLLTPTTALFAQMGLNAPAGLAPRQDMEIYTRNGFLVQQKFTFTTANPNNSVNTLDCTSPATLTAQAGILKDPGGDGTYPASQTCTQTVARSNSVSGYEIVFEQLETEANNDLVVITDGGGNAVTFSGNTLPAPFFVTGASFTVRFQANSNSTVGQGFRLRWREVYADNTTPTTPNTAFGRALQFDVNKGALMSGFLTIGALSRAGIYSTALGLDNTASGEYSTALGFDNTASGTYSTASGRDNESSGDYSTALGYLNTASGDYSTALGFSNTASGTNSTALGRVSESSGDYSTALGVRASTGGFQGAMALGDFITAFNATLITNTASTSANQLTARFSGGYRFISGYNTSTGAITSGAVLAPGGNSWAAISDSAKKERFRPLNHAEVLGKLGSLKLGSWNYKGQPDQRHYGPMAQDFFARFGHDGLGTIGCDTLLAGHDFTAITLAGVQALIRENEALKAKLNQANSRLEALESAVFIRRRGKAVARK